MSVSGNASSSKPSSSKPSSSKPSSSKPSPVRTTTTGLNISSTKAPTAGFNPYNPLPDVNQGKATPATSTVQNKPAEISESVSKALETHALLTAYDKAGETSAETRTLGQLAGLPTFDKKEKLFNLYFKLPR